MYIYVDTYAHVFCWQCISQFPSILHTADGAFPERERVRSSPKFGGELSAPLKCSASE